MYRLATSKIPLHNSRPNHAARATSLPLFHEKQPQHEYHQYQQQPYQQYQPEDSSSWALAQYLLLVLATLVALVTFLLVDQPWIWTMYAPEFLGGGVRQGTASTPEYICAQTDGTVENPCWPVTPMRS